MSPEKQIVLVANWLLAGEVDPIEACRKINKLKYETRDPDHEVFLLIRLIEDETDMHPLGDVRDRYDADYLVRMDRDVSEYLAANKSALETSCKELVATFEI